MIKNKILKKLQAKQTGRMMPVQTSSMVSMQETMDMDPYHPDLEYRIEMRLGATQIVPQEVLQQDEDIFDQMKQKVARDLVHELYGEIRSKLLDLNIQMRNEHYPMNSHAVKMVNELIDMVND